MNELDEFINKSLDILIENETFLGHELKLLFKTFKEEKTEVGFSFGKLCYWHYEAFSDSVNDDIYKIAAAVELLILSFDIIDDLQDKDSDNSWSRTPELSLNVALAMLIMASKTIDETSFEHKRAAINILEECALKSISGQQLDLLNNCRDEDSYAEMITLKSGSLTAMSCLIGEVLAKGEVSKEVEAYGKYIGIIQQIKNDIQSLKAWGPKNDLLNKRYSLPIIYLLSQKNDVSKSVVDYYNDDIVTILDHKEVENELTNGGAIRYAVTVKNVYKLKAINDLENVDLNDLAKDYLQKLIK